MPKITEARRESRREQVLEAARSVLQEFGLEAVSMEMIIARSGLSTGAVYGYFKGKNDIIGAVMTEGTAQLADELLPILGNPDPPPPAQLVAQVLETIVDFGPKDGGVDRLLVAIHAWSHAQSDPELLAAVRAAYGRLPTAYAHAARRWQESGVFDPSGDPEALAELLTSVTLGFVAQRALTGAADIDAHVRALSSLRLTE